MSLSSKMIMTSLVQALKCWTLVKLNCSFNNIEEPQKRIMILYEFYSEITDHGWFSNPTTAQIDLNIYIAWHRHSH